MKVTGESNGSPIINSQEKNTVSETQNRNGQGKTGWEERLREKGRRRRWSYFHYPLPLFSVPHPPLPPPHREVKHTCHSSPPAGHAALLLFAPFWMKVCALLKSIPRLIAWRLKSKVSYESLRQLTRDCSKDLLPSLNRQISCCSRKTVKPLALPNHCPILRHRNALNFRSVWYQCPCL